MQRNWFALCVLVLVPAWTLAQQPDPNAGKLGEVLGQWEKAMAGVSSLETTCMRSVLSTTFQTVEIFDGRAKILKSNQPNQSSRAMIELVKRNDQKNWERYIFTGTFIYIMDPVGKKLRVANQPAPNGQIDDSNFLEFLLHMKAKDITSRYNVQYVSTDKWYHYVRILPKPNNLKDKQAFLEARVVLSTSNSLPCQLWYKQGENEVTWDFSKMTPNAELNPNLFAAPNTPGGWVLERVGPR